MRAFTYPGYSVRYHPAKPMFRFKVLTTLLLVALVSPLASALAINKDDLVLMTNSSALHVSRGQDVHPDSKPGSDLVKREDNARLTFYETGLGACGGRNGPNDFIVALNKEQWDGGSHCWDQITINYGGKTTQAQIVDMCPGCPWGGLDMSLGLFSFFDNPDLGVLHGSWYFGGQAPPPASASTPVSNLPSLPSVSAALPSLVSLPIPQPTQEQAPPQSIPLLPSLLPSTTSSAATQTSVSTTSSTSISTPTNPILQTTQTSAASPSQTRTTGEPDSDSDIEVELDGDDVPASLFLDYLSDEDDAGSANNLQDLYLAIVNLVFTILQPDSPDGSESSSSAASPIMSI